MFLTQFEIQEALEGSWVRVTLLGELDMAAAPELDARLAELQAAGCSVLMDLSRLEFMDSTGLAIMARALRSSTDDGWAFLIDPNLAPQVRKLFRLTSVDQFVGVSRDATST